MKNEIETAWAAMVLAENTARNAAEDAAIEGDRESKRWAEYTASEALRAMEAYMGLRVTVSGR